MKKPSTQYGVLLMDLVTRLFRQGLWIEHKLGAQPMIVETDTAVALDSIRSKGITMLLRQTSYSLNQYCGYRKDSLKYTLAERSHEK